jgi:tRNA (Thr-GGU) A37 N-methylase
VSVLLTSIGVVRNSRTDIAMTDHWGEVTSTIVVDDRFGNDCLLGLAEFSHVEVLFVFDQTTEQPDYRPRGCLKRFIARFIARQLFKLLECYDQAGAEILRVA